MTAARALPLPVEVCDHAAALIERKSRGGAKALVIDWLHASC